MKRDFVNVNRSADAPARRYRDAEGEIWEVVEETGGYDRRGGGCLLFQTHDSFRRVRNCPPNWFELTDAELEALSRQR